MTRPPPPLTHPSEHLPPHDQPLNSPLLNEELQNCTPFGESIIPTVIKEIFNCEIINSTQYVLHRYIHHTLQKMEADFSGQKLGRVLVPSAHIPAVQSCQTQHTKVSIHL